MSASRHLRAKNRFYVSELAVRSTPARLAEMETRKVVTTQLEKKEEIDAGF